MQLGENMSTGKRRNGFIDMKGSPAASRIAKRAA
jgi:hypothetical protein